MLIRNRYEVHELIGAGGMAQVYRATDLQTGIPVAVKMLRGDVIGDDPHVLERFNREADALRQLSHPNIVKVLDAVEEDNAHSIIMEYVGGGSLYRLLKQQPQMPVNRVLEISLELADALTRAHHLKIIHRDIKPANVLLAEDGTPRLTDFGVAYFGAKDRLTGTDIMLGTLNYLPPEALNGGDLDTRGDIWAFGVMLFEMLAGERPFLGGLVAQIFAAILTQPTPDLEALRPDAPTPLIDLIYRMLEKDLNQRIPSVRLVGAQLEAILLGRNADLSHVVSPGGGNHLVFEPVTPIPPSTSHRKDNLIAQVTPFVGREPELAELAKLLHDPKIRLVTILAPGGMGKTRLSLEVARQATKTLTFPFEDGVYFVPLAPLTSPDNIVPAVANAINLQFYPGSEPKTQLLDYLREKHLLLVLDNFEHLMPGAAIVTDLLGAAGVKMIVTSRERLNLSGETVFNLDGMNFPTWETPQDALQYSAVKLFMQSAQRVRPDFELQPTDLADVAHICHLVRGMPLAILLAAAWVETLLIPEIAAEIEKNLDFLETEMRDVPSRQRSIRAVFDYSWNQLTPEERQVFKRLSFFRGGFTREATETVAEAGLRQLTALVSKSLLRRNPDSGRYEIHELLRQYAEEQLSQSVEEMDDIRAAHSHYYAQLLEDLWPRLQDRRQFAAFDVIKLEFDNICLAWETMVSNRAASDIARSVNSLVHCLMNYSRYHEIVDLLDPALAALRADLPDTGCIIGSLLAWKATSFTFLGRFDAVLPLLEEASNLLEGCTQWEYLWRTHIALAEYYLYMEDANLVRETAEKALQIAREHLGSWELSMSLGKLAQTYVIIHDGLAAKPLAEEAARLNEERGDGMMSAFLDIAVLGYVYRDLGEYETGIQAIQRTRVFCQEILQYHMGANISYGLLGYLTLAQGNYQQSKHYQIRRIKGFIELGNVLETMGGICAVAEAMTRMPDRSDHEEALSLCAFVLSSPHNASGVALNAAENERAGLQARLPPDIYQAAWERGKALNLEAVIQHLLGELETESGLKV